MRKDKKILKDKKNLRFPLKKKKKNGIRKLLFVIEIFLIEKKKETLLFNILQNHSGKGVLSDHSCVSPPVLVEYNTIEKMMMKRRGRCMPFSTS